MHFAGGLQCAPYYTPDMIKVQTSIWQCHALWMLPCWGPAIINHLIWVWILHTCKQLANCSRMQFICQMAWECIWVLVNHTLPENDNSLISIYHFCLARSSAAECFVTKEKLVVPNVMVQDMDTEKQWLLYYVCFRSMKSSNQYEQVKGSAMNLCKSSD